VAHTLKGSSGMVGLEVMEELAHSMEELLDDVRDGTRDVTAEMIDLLLLCNDKIEEILDIVARKEPVQVRVGHLLDGLDGFRAGEDVDLNAIRDAEASGSEESNDEDQEDDSDASAVTETIRVGTNKLDRVINLVGELTINKQQFDNSITDIDQIEREVSRLVDSADQLVNKNDLDTDLVEELRLIHGAIRDLNQDVEQASKEISRVNTNLQDAVMQTRMVPVAQLFQKFPRQVRDLARTEGKEVDFETRGDDTEMDKTVIEKIGDPLMHIIRNAIDHGIESPEERKRKGKPEEGKLVIEAGYEGDLAVIEIRDDGQGIHPDAVKQKAIENGVITENEASELSDQEAQELVFEPGFSTTDEVTETSGRGVGMDVVRSNITDLNGQVELDSTVGEGSTFTIKLPLTLAIVQVLQVRCGQEQLALPLSSIRETLRISTDRIDQIGQQEVFELRGSTLTLLRLSDVLQLPSRRRNHQDIYPVIVAEWGDRQVGILVDEMLEKQEVVIKDLGSVLNNVPFNSGATITGDGRVVLIVDLGRIVQQSEELSSETARVTADSGSQTKSADGNRARILVVDDSATARTMITDALEQEGYEVEEAKDGREALDIVEEDDSFDLISTDIKMPHVEGYEFVRELRTMEDYRHTSVVMVSSRDTRIDKMRGFEVGADDYLEKPFNAEEALDIFEELLEGSSSDSAAR
jgi:two-component system chemotaxis sensor kinase CheA